MSTVMPPNHEPPPEQPAADLCPQFTCQRCCQPYPAWQRMIYHHQQLCLACILAILSARGRSPSSREV
ncbi:MAG: hypothetical protein H0X24_01245 [Ktedonobacterales bacterium]|nr:hypothetical protein [Ktedonobacterales bacterium]